MKKCVNVLCLTSGAADLVDDVGGGAGDSSIDEDTLDTTSLPGTTYGQVPQSTLARLGRKLVKG